MMRRIIDLCMTVLLLFLMAYQVTGEVLHEWIGMAMILLVIVHQILNRRWYRAVFKGKYNPYRIITTAVTLLLLLSFLLTALLGMSMSSHVVPFLYGMTPLSFARSMHLTAAFIGEFSDPDLVLDVLEEVRFEPFRIRLDGIGSFGNLWWAGIGQCPELVDLVRRIRLTLAQAGIPFDRKKFSPHITLIRKAVSRDGSIPEAILEHAPEAEMTVDHVSLMRSDRGKKGMIYTEL